jgi:hypothetical protein
MVVRASAVSGQGVRGAGIQNGRRLRHDYPFRKSEIVSGHYGYTVTTVIL